MLRNKRMRASISMRSKINGKFPSRIRVGSPIHPFFPSLTDSAFLNTTTPKSKFLTNKNILK